MKVQSLFLILATSACAFSASAQYKPVLSNGSAIEPTPQGAIIPEDSPAGGLVAKAATTPSAMSPEELEMVDELNLVRTKPQEYAKLVEQAIADLEKGLATSKTQKDDKLFIKTAKELLAILAKQTPLDALAASDCIHKAAKVHAQELKTRGRLEHKGKTGSMPWDRIKKACKLAEPEGAENLVAGFPTVRKSVMILMVDVGIGNRGHRKTILNPELKTVGCGKVDKIGDMPNGWVQDFGF